jgi:hypothetical protein
MRGCVDYPCAVTYILEQNEGKKEKKKEGKQRGRTPD